MSNKFKYTRTDASIREILTIDYNEMYTTDDSTGTSHFNVSVSIDSTEIDKLGLSWAEFVAEAKVVTAAAIVNENNLEMALTNLVFHNAYREFSKVDTNVIINRLNYRYS